MNGSFSGFLTSALAFLSLSDVFAKFFGRLGDQAGELAPFSSAEMSSATAASMRWLLGRGGRGTRRPWRSFAR